jgi:hypothetical protein
MNCRSCKNDQLKLVIDLGIQAWCNNFLQKSEIGKEQTYPLRMFRCEKCGLCQLDTTVPKEIMFKEHTYVSGTTQSLKDHFYKVAKENIEQFDLKDGDVIYDIGGNDGTQLIQYRKLGINSVINIESATNIAKLSSKNGIPTMNEFFNEDFVRADSLGEIKLINAAGVFFHLEELHSVIRGIKLSLQEDGVFVVQFMYLGDMLEKLSFDGIYHEHLCYYSIDSLMKLLEPYGLNIFDAYHCDIHGGTIIAKFCNDQYYDKTQRLYDALKKDSELVNEDKLKVFGETIEEWRTNFTKDIIDLKNSGKKIYAFGAPAKGNTLLTYCGLDNDIIDYVFEVNDMKCGLYTPVTHIPIVKEDHSLVEDDSYIILLSWNFADEIIGKCQDLVDRGVQFIVPFGGCVSAEHSK